MGLLDQPLISEMDALEKKAHKGDEEALQLIFKSLDPIKKSYIQHLVARDPSLSLHGAIKKAGIVICIR
jgi:hypothetical protein